MNYFNSLTHWIERPLAEYNIELATLNIEEVLDTHAGQSTFSNVIMNDYTAHWLSLVFDQLQKKNSLRKQTDGEGSVNKEGYEFLKKLKAVVRLDKNSVDFVFAFISSDYMQVKNKYFQKVRTYCKTNKFHPNLHYAQIMDLAGRGLEFDRLDNCTLAFPVYYDAKFSYDGFAMNHVCNFISLHIQSIKNSKNKTFLVAFEFLKDLNAQERKRFFKSLIRSMAQTYYQSYQLNLENIVILIESESDIPLFNSARDEIVNLLEFNLTAGDWDDFYFKHPVVLSGKPIKEFKQLTGEEGFKVFGPNKEKDISVDSLTNKVLKDINTSDTKFIQELMVIEKIIDTDRSILLLGETGVGKSYLAEKIHEASSRNKKKLVTINCSAIPDTLIESELFGYEKGSHGKAYEKRIGYIEQANGGTLLLDEIGKATLNFQQKILLVMDNKKFLRLGGKKPVEVDIKFIFATNDNLKALIKSGDFLPELYYRISKFPITIPPLRKRIEDVEKFAAVYKNRFEEKYKGKVEFGGDEITVLKNHSWPGNLRELESVMEDLIVRNSVFKGEINEQKIKESFERFATETQGLELVEKSLLDLFIGWLGKKEQITKIVEMELSRSKGKEPEVNETSFGRSIVEPILANIYDKNHESLGLIQTAASEYIGLSWSGTKKESTLPQKLKLYPIVEEFFK